MCESYVHAYSKPCRSANCISSSIRDSGGSGRTVTPKLSMSSIFSRRADARNPEQREGGERAQEPKPEPATEHEAPERSRDEPAEEQERPDRRSRAAARAVVLEQRHDPVRGHDRSAEGARREDPQPDEPRIEYESFPRARGDGEAGCE